MSNFKTFILLSFLLHKVWEVENSNCGKTVGGRIVNGYETKTYYPFMVAIMVNNQQVCAGSIISERTVMTAAHCVRGFQASQMQIITGTNNLVPPFPKNSRRIKVAWTKYHPNYAPNIQHNDIAVIRLQCAVPFTGPNQIGDIVPACLPPAGTEFTGRSNCILIGWGQLSKYGQSVPRLREVKLPIQTPYTCTKKYGGSFVPKTMICAGDQSASGCHGDSGGPVICTQGSTNYVAGVVSHGDNYSCKVNGVYTKVNAFLSWLGKYK